MNQSKQNRTQSWLVLAAMGGVAVAYAYFIYLPSSRAMAEMQAELADAELQAEGTVSLVSAIGDAQEKLKDVSEYAQAWQEAAPSEHEMAEVFERIHELTRLAETETIRFEPQPVNRYETFLRFPLSMECRGTFEQLAAVVTGLERMHEPIWLRNIEFQSPGQDSHLITAEISLDVFADNLEDSDQDNLSGKPITQEAGPPNVWLERPGTDS